MKKSILRIVALMLGLVCLLSFTACEPVEEVHDPIDGRALFQAFLATVTFETELQEVEEGAESYFVGLPTSAQVRFFIGDSAYVDCLALVTVSDPSERSAAVKALYAYVDQTTAYCRSNLPEQVSKCNKAVIWDDDVYAILCITSDSDTAQNLSRRADEYAEKYADSQVETPAVSEPTQPQQDVTEKVTQPQQTQQETTEVTQPQQTTPPVVVDGEYPTITSASGQVSNYGEFCIRVDDMAYMPYKYRDEAATNYIKTINAATAQFGDGINVYSILIPTAIGVVLPDDVRGTVEGYEDQSARVEQINKALDQNIIRVNAYENLMKHRNEYLYFRTDLYWTGLGAYYAYEAFCQAKGVTPYTLDQRQCSVFENFKGSNYVDDQVSADEIHAYHPYFKDSISMVYTNRDGKQVQWEVIKDVSTWPENTRYNTFAGGDQPITVYNNAKVESGVAVVVKESFGNAMIPYLVDHYSVVYVIDYRYWNGNIAEFAKENGANDVIFANNMGMVSTATLVAMLADNF